AERWMATTLQSHLSHPVLAFYRAQQWGESWLASVATVLDACALLVVGGDGPRREQARITYRMGIRLLKELTEALNLANEPRYRERLTKADMPAVLAVVNASNLPLNLGPRAAIQLFRLVRLYDVHLTALAGSLLVPLPSWARPKAQTDFAIPATVPRVRTG